MYQKERGNNRTEDFIVTILVRVGEIFVCKSNISAASIEIILLISNQIYACSFQLNFVPCFWAVFTEKENSLQIQVL